MLLWVALLGLLGVSALALLRVRRTQFAPATLSTADGATTPFAPAVVASGAQIAFRTPLVAQTQAECFRLAFSVRHDYQVLGQHAEVVTQANSTLLNAIQEQRHFPRRPALLPKLLHALNARDSTRKGIARLILQDAALAGAVLARANSSYYQHGSGAHVDSIDRAVALLGVDGLRAPVAAVVMQPVFSAPRGLFEHFAPMTWDQAHRSALAAERYARLHHSGDPFSANLAALISGLGNIVLFRHVLDCYRQRGNLMPRSEVFIEVMTANQRMVTRRIAQAWRMSDRFLAALDAQLEQRPPQQMTPLGAALYYGELCGALSLLVRHALRTRDNATNLLSQQGLNDETIDAMLDAAEEPAAK